MNDKLKQDIFQLAHDTGFPLVGVTAPEILHPDKVQHWLDQGYAGSMAYLHNHLEKRLDPKKLVPGTQSILCLAVNYFQKPPANTPHTDGKIALYAWGRDYHRVIKEMLHTLAKKISNRLGRKIRYRAFVDTGPVLEKILAWQAGLGWIGKNTCFLNRQWGSYLFLGELFLDIPLPPDQPGKDHCGRCQRCIDTCPTHAIIAPHTLDARRCISYLTIEHRDEIPDDLQSQIKDQLFGCDLCQQVCPFNRRAVETQTDEFRDHRLGPSIPLTDILSWTDADCRTRTTDSAGDRAALPQWQRNARLLLDARRRLYL